MWNHAPWQGRYLPSPLAPRRAPPRLRDLVQRRRGQHHLLRHPGPRHRPVVGRPDQPGLPVRPQAAETAHPREPPHRHRRDAPHVPGRDRAPRDPRSHALDPAAALVQPRRPRRAGQLPPPACPRGYRYAVEVRHRAFFQDPHAAQQLERTLAPAAAEWVTFDTTVLFASPPATAAEREAWERKPRLPRRPQALTSHPIVRYIGRDDVYAQLRGGPRGSTRWPAGCGKAAPRRSSSTRRTTSARSSWPAGSTTTSGPGCPASSRSPSRCRLARQRSSRSPQPRVRRSPQRGRAPDRGPGSGPGPGSRSG